ncbi:NfeD family protein [Marinimicrobium sp. ABcell2]|uniref:NfeD family protein n=1 Tax=Marinimicrobium sp. ABcell2 TaxID=3069751 RepID=UPI0027B7C5D3|nr:NfeD family protein [Marinimicrobium sp. ABcell2]MDQ2076252.1 NfeD family protein [Marinimicrobium sp. ABcell2]
MFQDYDLFALWFIAGAVLMLLELVIPGGIVIFLGIGAVLVSFLLYTGVIDGWLQAFTVWFIGSLVLVFALRGLVQKLIPAQVERGKTDEDLDAYDQVAVVAERIPAQGEGRINFRGSTWAARCHQPDLEVEAGTQVRVVLRENLVWLVEPVDPPVAPDEQHTH